MKIEDGLNLPGWRVEIPDCSRLDLPEFFRNRAFRVGAEIGVRTGEFTELFCQHGQKVFAIDPWMTYDDYVESITQEEMEANYQITKSRMERYNCLIVRKPSMEALRMFDDGVLDWVYLDGNHSFVFVAQDIYYWSKKVKKGGVISGHDYAYIKSEKPFHMHVKFVVDAYTKAMGIPKWYVLGEKHAKPGEKRDKWRSWMWFNV